LRSKIVDDVQDSMVALPLLLCSYYFFVAGLQAQERPTFAACALSVLRINRTQNEVLSKRARNGVLASAYKTE
jgi:hypothetical protein